MTARGSLIGTPFYMSPEQIRGEELDARIDLYSLGALMYRMLTGAHPFTAPTPVAVLTQHLTEELMPPSQRKPELHIAPRVDAIVDARDGQAARRALRVGGRAARGARRGGVGAVAAAVDGLAGAQAGQRSRRRARRRVGGDAHRRGAAAAARGLRRLRARAQAAALAGRCRSCRCVLAAAAAAAFVYFAQRRPEGARCATSRSSRTTRRRRPTAIASGRPITRADRQAHRRRGVGPRLLPLSRRGQRAAGAARGGDRAAEHGADARGVRRHRQASIAEADNGGVGDGEIIPNLRLQPGEHYVAVREVWTRGAAGDGERERLVHADGDLAADGGRSTRPSPTTRPSAALPLTVGEPMRGYARAARRRRLLLRARQRRRHAVRAR